MSEHRYVLADAEHDAERARLTLLEAVHDPNTTRRLAALGVGPGWRCLEVGAGGGSVARWLAERVGPSGSVVATDLNPRYLSDLPDNVEVRAHDIVADPLEADAYDLVHCRAFLMHMADPEAILTRLVGALRPGGWLLAEEGEWGLWTVGAHSDSDWATAFMQQVMRAADAGGFLKPFFGRRLPGIVSGLGLVDVGGESGATAGGAGHPAIERHRMDVAQSRAGGIAAGLGSEADYDRLEAVLAAPETILLGSAIVAAWGRKPGRGE